ncbi:glycosyl hydrolase family 28-related protein [Granulicella sibirica]|uniref:Gluconolactonase n=1 Tax=Granulicella sibirica TaxID=2479048 RepID=A0A4Q0STP1_9BACT|nr:glycosyl hydrolase family 28-related protein [Granulicella sibirica]RXH54355.1 Gluconolactonase [Granulicella sibirica]
MSRLTLLLLVAFSAPIAAQAQSFYPTRLEDKTAVYLSPGHDTFGTKADGIADDTAALQKAIDTVADTTHQGILFIPEGHYRITKTLYVWPGIRLIGYGAQRPTLILPANTPGYQTGPSYMVIFTGGRTGERRRGGLQRPANAPAVAPAPFAGTVPPTINVVDANPGTFYSAMSNIDFEIGDANPGAVGIRFHVAQHCFLTHMNFHIGSGMAALQDIGNEAEDLHFDGGQFAIMTGRPSPGWQFTLLDSTFDGQREAAIKEHEAGLVLIHDTFKNVPTAVDIEPKHIEELWIKNSRFENISGPAILISEENSRLTEINVEDALCDRVKTFAQLRDSGKTFSGAGPTYRVATFSHGLTFDSPKARGVIVTRIDAKAIPSLPPASAPAIQALPTQTNWANALELGAKGDGSTDDTAALQHIVDTNRIIYLPSGRYRLTNTLRLRPDTVLIGLHPSTTQFDLSDSTPGFDGPGAPKAMLLAPQGGTNIVTGIGLFSGGVNSRSVAVMWMAGKDSLMDDVRFLGGHGTNNADGTRMNPYNNTHSGDPNPLYRWDVQYPSLWVLNGGGGTFSDIWTPDTFSQAGLYISDTKTEGHVYELSSEHHVRNEVKLKRVSNWEIVALQTEEERGEGPQCLPLAIEDSDNITVAEFHAYRVVSSFVPYDKTIHVSNSHNIRFRNLHIYSDSKAAFDSSVKDDDSGITNRELEIASLTIPEKSPAAVATRHIQATRLTGSFFNPSSATVDSHGQLYFVDTVKQHIFRYLPADKRLEVVRDNAIEPGNIFFDHSDNLMVISYAGATGTVYTFKPDSPATDLQILEPQPAAPHPGMTAVLPADHWRFTAERATGIGGPQPWQYVSPDGSTFLPAGEDFVSGALYYGIKMADILRAFTLSPATPGKTFYVSDEGEKMTWSGQVAPDGSLTHVKPFTNQGGESIAVAPDGKVYLAAGQIYIYNPNGTPAGEIDVPERPISIVFGGKDHKTLYILARTSLYSASIP